MELKTISKAIKEIEKELSKNSTPHPYLKTTLDAFKELQKHIAQFGLIDEKAKSLAGGIGRLATDDYKFAESKLGGIIFDAINSVLEEEEQ